MRFGASAVVAALALGFVSYFVFKQARRCRAGLGRKRGLGNRGRRRLGSYSKAGAGGLNERTHRGAGSIACSIPADASWLPSTCAPTVVVCTEHSVCWG
jgi:hypothetical protein